MPMLPSDFIMHAHHRLLLPFGFNTHLALALDSFLRICNADLVCGKSISKSIALHYILEHK